jgi:hypothetical protein
MIANPLQSSPYLSDTIVNNKINDLERNLSDLMSEIEKMKDVKPEKQQTDLIARNSIGSCCYFILFIILFVLVIILYTKNSCIK